MLQEGLILVNNKGFFLLENLIVFTLGILLLLSTLKIYDECLLIMHKKLILERALATAELTLAQRETDNEFQIITKNTPTALSGLNWKEVEIRKNEDVILSIAVTE